MDETWNNDRKKAVETAKINSLLFKFYLIEFETFLSSINERLFIFRSRDVLMNDMVVGLSLSSINHPNYNDDSFFSGVKVFHTSFTGR